MTGNNLRATLAADPLLGAGNVVTRLLELGADPHGPGLAFDTDTPLTLGELDERVRARAAWLHERGVKPRDPVAVYVRRSADCFLTFFALNRLGAIPALMNPNIPMPVANQYIAKLKATAVLTDPGRAVEHEQVWDVAESAKGDPAKAPSAFRHHEDDPIAITHSSGTTRMPTAVVHSHSSLFAATRRIRLMGPRAQGTERVLSALPAPHTAGILAVNQALVNRAEILFLSTQDDAELILDAIERWKPTGVFGFAVTWAELARHDLTERDMDSVAIWFNTGDCAHEAHIRKLVAVGSHVTVAANGQRERVKGSTFYDGIGSTEMGHSAFHIGHRVDTNRYGRCVGKPHVFADVRVLDLETGDEMPVGKVGHLGLKSPTLSLGYWNDHAQTFRTRYFGYYLTGDLMYRDEEGYYYHMDRAVDAVDLGGGNWLYTAMSEERILAANPSVRDCTVVAVNVDGRVVTDILVLSDSDYDPDAVTAALEPHVAATVRKVIRVTDADLVTGPTGKVRKFLMRQRHLATL
ncbi:class I adenylate-forming enzyme family protein [Allorhizocola rhizosphaerae]|uniref:class I adenylate-forming enzyme family protein n=1 Tax=Allorhizocola rhizosphaerae TaxID=1872709 RepID=UPI000E3D0EDE|nr:class I adenylate-forming enzyme family protein [Allorhizocola rhizosphaerae]